jgi:Protein of unknown function (DUF2934)
MPAAKESVKASARKTTPPPVSQAKITGSRDITKKDIAPKTAAKKPTTDNRPQTTLNPEERYRMIAVAAYYRAEKRGFVGGDPAQDWVDAEAEVEQLIRK